VLNSTGSCSGILSLSDYGRAFERGDPSLAAREIATSNVVTVTEEETLSSALRKFTSGDFAILPVVDPGDRKRLVGVIGRRDIMTAINDAVVRKRIT
jgi:chloride channel protein, CIC family